MAEKEYLDWDGLKEVEKKVERYFRLETMPEPGEAWEDKIVQYIGETGAVYKNGYFYKCQYSGYDYEWVNKIVQPNTGQTIQYDTMPTANRSALGKIVQYVGTSSQQYTNGYFYECVEKEESGETVYVWENKLIQQGGDSRIGDEINKIGVRQEGAKLIPYIRFQYAVPPFNTLSWDEVYEYTQMYYNGEISLEDIQNAWSLGDSIPISFSAMQAMTNFDDTHSAQTNEMQIVDFNTYNIENTETKCLLTLQMKDCFNEKGKMDIARVPGNTWLNEPRRTWCRDYVYPSLSANVKAIIKNVERTTGVVDSIFIPTSKEVMNYLPSGGNPTFGTLYEYYETQANRVKKIDGTIDDYFCANQTGQSSGSNTSFYPIVNTDGSGTTASMDTLHGLAIAFCI